MVLSELLQEIAPEWREDYVRFVDTGEASDDLLCYLDAHEDCRRLIEFVFADPTVPTDPTATTESAEKPAQSPHRQSASDGEVAARVGRP